MDIPAHRNDSIRTARPRPGPRAAPRRRAEAGGHGGSGGRRPSHAKHGSSESAHPRRLVRVGLSESDRPSRLVRVGSSSRARRPDTRPRITAERHLASTRAGRGGGGQLRAASGASGVRVLDGDQDGGAPGELLLAVAHAAARRARDGRRGAQARRPCGATSFWREKAGELTPCREMPGLQLLHVFCARVLRRGEQGRFPREEWFA